MRQINFNYNKPRAQETKTIIDNIIDTCETSIAIDLVSLMLWSSTFNAKWVGK